jgi:hypothetical protein
MSSVFMVSNPYHNGGCAIIRSMLLRLALIAVLLTACDDGPSSMSPPDGAPTGDAAPDAAVPGDAAPFPDATAPEDAAPSPDDAAPLPCVRVRPATIDFGTVRVGERAAVPVTVEACDGGPAAVRSVEVAGAGFAVEAPLDVVFAPAEAGSFAGTLRVVADDGMHAVPLEGEAVANACPVPLVAPAQRIARPLQPVPLEAPDSRDPDGAIARWTWVVVERPPGSSAAPAEALADPERPFAGGPPDDPATPAALFVPDVAGAFTLELRVTDDGGLEAPSARCPGDAARLRVDVEPPGDLTVQLTWTAPGGGPGPDLDLHLRHPASAGWGEAPLDCFSGNPRPDWGRPGDSADDPVLGGHHSAVGPEAIAMAAPDDAPDGYRIGVTWPSAAQAAVRVYLGGTLVDLREAALGPDGGLWEVGRVVWTPERRAFEPQN